MYLKPNHQGPGGGGIMQMSEHDLNLFQNGFDTNKYFRSSS